MKKLPSILLSLLSSFGAIAQVAQEDIERYLKAEKFDIDTEASAVVLKETILCDLSQGNRNYTATQKVYKLIKILKQDAVREAELQALVLKNFYNGDLHALKGCTYNLVGGEVKKSELSTGDVFKSDVTKELSHVRFTLPDVRAGSVIEYSYELWSPVTYVFPPWRIEENYPKLYTEYAIHNELPFSFRTILQTNSSPKEFTDVLAARACTAPFVHSRGGAQFSVWMMRNVHGVNDQEPFVRNISSYRQRMEFRIVTDLDESADTKSNWQEFAVLLWNSAEAKATRDKNLFFADTVKALIWGKDSQLGKARAIFNYVRQNFEKVENSEWGASDIKTTFKNRRGQSVQLNLLLVAMLISAGLECYPMLGSTSETSAPLADMPRPERFTRVFCALAIDSSFVYMDASDKNNAFGMLPPECYNGLSFVGTPKGEFAQLTPDLIEDISIISARVTMPKENVRQVELTYKMGLVSSGYIRKALATRDSDEEKITANLFREINDDYSLTEKHLENLANPDTNLVFKATWTQPFNEAAPVFFLQSSLVKARSKNSFPPAKRIHQIEFPYRTKQSYYTTIELPKGYVIDSVPPGKIFSLDDGNYEYKRTSNYIADMNIFTTNVTIANKKVVYDAEDYDNFRAIHEDILKEENRMVEVRKK